MARLIRCIFKIDEYDYALLMKAKRQELVLQGISSPTDSDVIQHITSDEIGRHCKRATRGIKETTSLISDLIMSLDGEKGVRLYTQVSTVKKGGIELPVYKCVRGYTSLENFHLHMARFIPGKLANDTNFQVYLLDGILDGMQIGLLRLSLVPANKQQMFQGLVCIVLICSSGLRFVQLSLATEQITGLRIFLSHAYNSDCACNSSP